MYKYQAEVYNVVDGDTVDVMVDLGFKMYSKQRIRLARIDTPERGQVGYTEAAERLKQLVLGKKFLLVTTKASKWGYFLGELYFYDTDPAILENVNTIMLSEGLAKPYDGGTK